MTDKSLGSVTSPQRLGARHQVGHVVPLKTQDVSIRVSKRKELARLHSEAHRAAKSIQTAAVEGCSVAAPRTHVVKDTASPVEKWWKRDMDLWENVAAEDGLVNAIGRSCDKELVVVDWYASFCLGCRLSAPHLASLAADPELKARCKFVRACADDMLGVARREGARRIPHLTVYTVDGRKIVGFSAAASRRDTWKPNILTVLREGVAADFYSDDQGYVRDGRARHLWGVEATCVMPTG